MSESFDFVVADDVQDSDRLKSIYECCEKTTEEELKVHILALTRPAWAIGSAPDQIALRALALEHLQGGARAVRQRREGVVQLAECDQIHIRKLMEFADWLSRREMYPN